MSREESPTLLRRAVAESVGTFFLLATVVGSGIMAERLFPDSVGLALLANSLATGAALVALILSLAPISGAHFNPAVSLSALLEGQLPARDAAFYLPAQLSGALAGVAVADLMFELPAYSISQHARHGFGQLLSEFVATFGLLMVIRGCSRSRSTSSVAAAVAAYITAAYWFTASTSFANPAVTVARCLSDTFAGIAPGDAPGFIAAQLAGAVTATLLFRWLLPGARVSRDEVALNLVAQPERNA
jgi:glycerol uptake facilitator-like aquaporin